MPDETDMLLLLRHASVSSKPLLRLMYTTAQQYYCITLL